MFPRREEKDFSWNLKTNNLNNRKCGRNFLPIRSVTPQMRKFLLSSAGMCPNAHKLFKYFLTNDDVNSWKRRCIHYCSIHWLADSFFFNVLSANDLLKGLLAWWKTYMSINCALSLDHLASTHFPRCIIYRQCIIRMKHCILRVRRPQLARRLCVRLAYMRTCETRVIGWSNMPSAQIRLDDNVAVWTDPT